MFAVVSLFVWTTLLAAPLAHAVSTPGERIAPPVLTGQVIAADGASVQGLRVFVRAASFADSVDVDSAGTFSLALTAEIPDHTVELSVDAADRNARRFHPALVHLQWEELGGEQRFILVPRRWTIASGTLAGTAVEISPQRAFTAPCEGCSGFYLRAGSASRAASPARVPIQSWPEAMYPLRVAFDHERSGDVLMARDSLAFWRIAENLEQQLGSKLFRPARYEETVPGEDEPEPEDVILVWIEPTMRPSGLGIAVSQGGNIMYGAVRLQRASSIASSGGPSLVMHEMVHALGFGHTCAWRSIVADVTRCPAMRSESLTPEDVAYAQLLRRVRDLQRQHKARWGMETALAGERVLVLRMPLDEPRR